MKRIIWLLLVFLSPAASRSQTPSGTIIPLTFNQNGTFKIAQFTDIHLVPDAPESQPSLKLIQFILDAEKPDLVVFTGDIVTGKPAKKGWEMVLEPVIGNGIPFAVTPGNHDDEHDVSRAKLRNILGTYALNVRHQASAQSPYGDYQVKISPSGKKETEAATLYFLDSNAYSTSEKVEGYGWFTHEQVMWCQRESQKSPSSGKEKPLALAFFHIPLPEYKTAFDSEASRTGQRNEDECAPEINTGMFAAMLLGKKIRGTFVGHDHVNDYLVDHYGIGLAYGRFSGGKTTYGDLSPGARIILLQEEKNLFETWLRLNNGEIVDKVKYPFKEKK